MTPAQAAAFRLRYSGLPVHEHRQAERESQRGKVNQYSQQRRSVKRPGVGKGGGQGRPVLIDGTRYPTLKAAMKAHGVGVTRFYNWIASGRARYCK